MGVRTTADEQLDKAAEGVSNAISALGEIVINQCWGHEDYKSDYRETIKTALMDLISIRDRLDR